MVIVMSSYENQIVKLLNKEGIFFQREKTFEDLRGGKYRYDFYLQNVQGGPVIIEIDGEQHFKDIYGRQKQLIAQENDRRKNSYALANSIPMYRIPYWKMKEIKTKEDLFKEEFLVRSRWHNDDLWRNYCRSQNRGVYY